MSKLEVGVNDLETYCKKNNRLDLLNEWDYKGNGELLPSMFTYGSAKKVLWKCKECGNKWKTGIYSRYSGTGCPRCAKELRSSFPEQVLFYYLKQIYPDAINGDRHLGKELDIYIPSQRLAFEYDGNKWHQNIGRDLEKNSLCKKEGITLYRIREKGCPILNDNKAEIITVENESESEVIKALKKIFERLDISIEIDLSKDRAKIYTQYLKTKKDKSIAAKYPELLKIWDYQNNIIKPTHIYPGSAKKVWWICSKGHHYQQDARSAVRGFGCPICDGKQVLKGYNDFETWCKQNNRLDLLDQWDNEKNTITPDSIIKSARIGVWWRCNEGHLYKTYAYSRIIGNNCPYCSGRKTLKGFNDLTTMVPELVKEWDYKKNSTQPFKYTKSSSKKAWWICSRGHSYEARISDKARGKGCPYCAGRKAISGVNDLATLYPQLLSEWNYDKNKIDPHKISPGSDERVWWKCSKNHIWSQSPNIRVLHNHNCPYCANRLVWKGYNDLETLSPSLAKEWNYEKNELKPSEVLNYSNNKCWWKCEKGHTWEATVSNRQQGTGCPYCSNKKVLIGYNDLQCKYPQIAKEWYFGKNGNLKPTDVVFGSGKRVWWKCDKCGNEWQASIANRTNRISGCPNCYKKRMMKNV